MTTRCTSCSHLNEEGSTFCANCNHFLAWSGPASPAPAPSTPAPANGTASGRAPDVEGLPRLVAAIEASAALADEQARGDLGERLGQARARIDSRTVTVAVVGEFKRGKSTLVNALIQTAACPVDADIVTAVPTLVRYGERLAVTAHVRAAGEQETVTRLVDFGELTSWVSESRDDATGDVSLVEVRVPHRILRSGLRLLDTPGVGGLESVHGQVTLAGLDGVDAVLFVTDASQELTAPEMEFLRTALDRCPTAAVVVTKTDLYQHWRRVVELDRAHLAAAGLDLPLLPVSSFLRLRAARQPELNEESGFAPLVEFLARDVVHAATLRETAAVAHEVDFVAGQLAHQADAERVVLARPDQRESLVDRLGQATARAQALGGPAAGWQQALGDGIQDLVADVEHDLQARLRGVLKEVREIIDRSDPKETWSETEGWLRREVAAAGVASRDLLVARAAELADAVAEQFSTEAGEAVELELELVGATLEQLRLPSASTFSMPGGRLGSLVIAARTSVVVPMLVVSLGQFLFPPLLLAGAAALLGAGLGGKLFRDEGRRQRSYRQTQAKAAAGKFVDEIAFEMNKATRDGLRRTHRRLRDEFQSRARSLHASASGALAAAERTATLPPDERARRATRLDEEAVRLAALRGDLRALSGTGGAGVR